MKLRLYRIPFIFLFLNPFIAAQNCDLSLMPKNVKGVHYISKEGKLSCRHLDAVFENIEFVNDLSSMFIEQAPETHILFAREGDNAFFDKGLILNFPQQFKHSDMFGNKLGPGATFEEVMSVATHEYGHRIFEEFLKQKLKGKKEYEDWFELAVASTRIKLQLVELENQRTQSLDGNIEEKMAKLNEQRKVIEQKMMDDKKVSSFHKLASRYHEFVADVIAVYTFHDKSIVTDALSPKEFYDDIGMMRGPQRYMPRDATFMGQRPRDRENYVQSRDFENSYTYELEKVNYAEPHAFYYKVRRFVGEKMWPAYKDLQSAQKYIQIIFEECYSDLVFNFNHPRKEVDQIQLNNELIERLEQRL